MFASAVRALAAYGYADIRFDVGGKKSRRRYVVTKSPDGEHCSIWVKSATRWHGLAEAVGFPWKKLGPSATGAEAVMKACRAATEKGASHLLAISGDWQNGELSVALLFPLEIVPSLVADQYALTHNSFYRTHSAALVIQSSSPELFDAAALAVTAGEDILRPPDRVKLGSLLRLKAQRPGSAGYLRDARVRAEVIQMAEGRCECCGVLGFATENGERYLESHHVVEVSQRGPDSPTNVVAVCPSCHRKAHYAADRSQIERRMLEAIRRRGIRVDSTR
jgi:hypothetical protein